VRYYAVMNRRPTDGVNNDELRQCWANAENECATVECHDRLRDQPTTVEIGIFNETWAAVAEELKGSIVDKDEDSTIYARLSCELLK
jgi:hypothetical protein